MQNRNNSSQFILSVIFSLMAVIINYGISFFITPYITENIGTEAYGFVNLAKTFAGYASIITVAINGFAARYVSIEYHKGNYKEANKYFSSIFWGDFIVAAVLLGLFGCIIYKLENFISIPESLVNDVKLLFLLDVINLLSLSLGTVFMISTTIINRLDISGIIKSLSYITEALFLAIVFRLRVPKVYYIGLGLILSSFVLVALNMMVTHKYTPELKVERKSFSKSAVITILKSGVWNSINNLGGTLHSGLDLLITNIMLSPLMAGQLAIIKTITVVFTTLFQLIAQPFQPLQLKYYALGDKPKLIDSFIIAMKVDGLFSNLLAAGFAVFGAAFYSLWVPSEDSSVLQLLTIITIAGTLTEGATYPLFYSYTLTVKNKIPCFVTLGSGVLNLISMYILIKFFNMGLSVVVGTTAVVSIFGNFIFTPLYAAHCLNIKPTSFFPTIIKHSLSAVTMIILFNFTKKIIYPQKWLELTCVAILCSAIGIIVHCIIVLSKEDRRMIKKILFNR